MWLTERHITDEPFYLLGMIEVIIYFVNDGERIIKLVSVLIKPSQD